MPQAKCTPMESLYKRKPGLPTDISTLQRKMDGDESGGQEVGSRCTCAGND